MEIQSDWHSLFRVTLCLPIVFGQSIVWGRLQINHSREMPLHLFLGNISFSMLI